MEPKYKEMIRSAYNRSKTSSIVLFQTLLDISKELDWDQTLALLEECVIERRLAWWEQNKDRFESSGDPCRDALDVFYKSYLGASLPEDGEIVSAENSRWVTRWWNRCPTLEACQHFGLDTREICKKVYEKPVQSLFERIDPSLRFRRNYEAIRPHAGYCEEIIEVEK